jgi:single-strand DNA-binding protein
METLMSTFSINRVTMVARLTRDPELRSLPSGSSVCSLRVACNGIRKDDSGEYVERPNYFDVSVFGAQGEAVSQYTHKGSRIALDGRLEWREWETAEQDRRQAVQIVADTVQFLDSAPGNGSEGGEDDDGELVGAGASADALGF